MVLTSLNDGLIFKDLVEIIAIFFGKSTHNTHRKYCTKFHIIVNCLEYIHDMKNYNKNYATDISEAWRDWSRKESFEKFLSWKMED